MVADTQIPPDAVIDIPLHRRPRRELELSWFDRLTSVPALLVALVAVSLLAAGPVQEVDRFLAQRWLVQLDPSSLAFAQNVLDRIAGQAVCLPVLAVVAIVLARRRRSWRPVVIALLAEAGFLGGVGTLKVLLGRGASSTGDPRFFEAGLLEMGTLGISFPSGHAAEAVLIYGTAVHLIAHYSSASRHAVRNLRWIVVLICVNSVTVSFLLGWHWVTDLIGGLLAGGLLLRLLVQWDRRTASGALRSSPESVTVDARVDRPHPSPQDATGSQGAVDAGGRLRSGDQACRCDGAAAGAASAVLAAQPAGVRVIDRGERPERLLP